MSAALLAVEPMRPVAPAAPIDHGHGEPTLTLPVKRSFEHVVHAVCKAMEEPTEPKDPCTKIMSNKKESFFGLLAFCYMFNITSAAVLFLCVPCILCFFARKAGKADEQEEKERKERVLGALRLEIQELDALHGAGLQVRLDRNRADFLWNSASHLYLGLECKPYDDTTSYSELITNSLAEMKTNLEQVKNEAETTVGHDAKKFHKSLWVYEKSDVIKYTMDNHGVLNFFLGDNTGRLQRHHRFAMTLCCEYTVMSCQRCHIVHYVAVNAVWIDRSRLQIWRGFTSAV